MNKTPVIIMAWGIITISYMTILGYMISEERWIGGEGMAFNTGVCFLLTGISLLILSREDIK